MNKMKKFKSVSIMVLASIILVVLLVGATLAYFTDATERVENTFQLSSVETEILEVISDMEKKPYVHNVGNADCIVRMRVNVSPANILDEVIVLEGLGGETDKWVLASDGFYYYQGYLQPGEITTEPLFTAVGFQTGKEIEDLEEFEIVLYQEAVQTRTMDQGLNAVVNGAYDHSQAMLIWSMFDKNSQASN